MSIRLIRNALSRKCLLIPLSNNKLIMPLPPTAQDLVTALSQDTCSSIELIDRSSKKVIHHSQTTITELLLGKTSIKIGDAIYNIDEASIKALARRARNDLDVSTAQLKPIQELHDKILRRIRWRLHLENWGFVSYFTLEFLTILFFTQEV